MNITSVLMALLLLAIAAGPASASIQTTVNLGTADNFVILSKSGITNVPTSAITGNIGTSPITGAAITGLGCSEVKGTIYTVDAAGPACRVLAPVLLTAAVSDMETAYTDAAGRTLPDYINLGTGNIGGLTLTPGLYKWSTGVTIPTDVTISGSSTDVWIFQIAGTLDIASAKQVILSGGAQAKNIYWQVAGATTLGTTSIFNGNILAKTNIAIQTGATLNGRALAQTAVTLDKNYVNLPKPNVPTLTPTTTQKSFLDSYLGYIQQNVGL
ncbi:MAG: ice-binding family protein [Candidatus Methanoperedens sp.]|nr:ice-binding family protein [Candidatus Methanoperedens sp.]